MTVMIPLTAQQISTPHRTGMLRPPVGWAQCTMLEVTTEQWRRHLHELIAGVKDLLIHFQLNTRARFSRTLQHCLHSRMSQITRQQLQFVLQRHSLLC